MRKKSVFRLAVLIAILGQTFSPSAIALDLQALNNNGPVAPVKSATTPAPPAQNSTGSQLQTSTSFLSATPMAVTGYVLSNGVPQGWTRTQSNMNYAYRISGGNGSDYQLNLMDLKTGQQQRLVSAKTVYSKVDVSSSDTTPGGPVVIYSFNNESQPLTYPTGQVPQGAFSVVQRVNNPAQKWKMAYGEIKNLRYTAYGEVALETYSFNAVTVNLSTLKTVNFVNPAQEYVNSPDGHYQIKNESATGRILVADLQTGKGLREIRFSLSESPVVSINVTKEGVYYVTGNSATPQIRFVSFAKIFASVNFTVPESAKQTIWTIAIPKNRSSIQFVSGQARAYITDIFGRTYLIDLKTGWIIK